MTAALENTKQLREYTYLALFLFLDSVYYFDDSQEMFLTRPGNGHYFSCCTISPIPLFNRVMTMFIFDYKDLKSLMIFCKIVARNQLFLFFRGFPTLVVALKQNCRTTVLIFLFMGSIVALSLEIMILRKISHLSRKEIAQAFCCS